MTTITHNTGTLPTRFASLLSERFDPYIERLQWDADRLAEHQRERLRALLTHAVERSPFHARRLRRIDPARVELEQLADLPVMRKEDMMERFDELLTDRRLTRARVEQHLADSAHKPRLLLGEYVCLASGGSSGLRGMFVQTIDEYADFAATVLRRLMAGVRAAGGPPPDGVVVGIVAAPSPVHSSGFAAAIATGYPVHLVPAPATLPLQTIVERLNDLQPAVLLAHTSRLAMLAGEQQAGRLQIGPRAITAMGETLTAEDRDAIEAAFGVALINQFTSTEGLVGHSEPGRDMVNFATDTCIVELVDADNRPVPEGAASAKALVTNLHNLTQPLIRYELTDVFIRHPSLPNQCYLRATIEGRADDVFRYGSLIAIDPLAIRTVMVRTPAVREYQVHQTNRGADVAVVVSGDLDDAALTSSLEQSLSDAGLAEPQVRVRRVAEIAVHLETGKARRFIPL